jgi:ribosomal protein S18 acetylase RimI-like enzyme
MLTIREFAPNYIDSLNECFNLVFDSSELAYYQSINDFSNSFIAVDNFNNIKGFIIVNNKKSKFGEYEIAYLGVSEQYRGKGYGKLLLNLVMTRLKGYCLWLNALANNSTACKMYMDLGFKEVERYVDNSGNNSIAFSTVDCLK